MDTQQAYNIWAEQYDTNDNKTRDLEATALQQTLAGKRFDRILEIGCGTGKNTSWLETISNEIVAVDLSEEMLSKARSKMDNNKVQFQQADILQDWTFAIGGFDLVTFSLVLEHIEDLDPVLAKASAVLKPGGYIYIGELHPFKQYSGSKARFETAEGIQVVTCFNHHISDFVQPAKQLGFTIEDVRECFDDDDKTAIPRILSLLLRKQ